MFETDEVILTETIDRYGENKVVLDEYKKKCDADGKEIKSIMQEAKLNNFDTDKYTAKITTVDKSFTDEAKLLQVIHSYNIPDSLGIIKTKEYIDEDALESAIYNGEISEEVLKQIAICKVEKYEYRLNVKKAK